MSIQEHDALGEIRFCYLTTVFLHCQNTIYVSIGSVSMSVCILGVRWVPAQFPDISWPSFCNTGTRLTLIYQCVSLQTRRWGVRQFSVGPLNVTGFRLAHYIHRMMQPRMFSISQPDLAKRVYFRDFPARLNGSQYRNWALNCIK